MKLADESLGLRAERLFDKIDRQFARVGIVDYRIMDDEWVIAALQDAGDIGMTSQSGDVDADGFAGVGIDFRDDDPEVFSRFGGFGNEETIPTFERQTILPPRAKVINTGEIIEFVDNGVDIFLVFV